jgi:hypothetical protein
MGEFTTLSMDGRQPGSNPETPFKEIKPYLPEADFWFVSLKVCSGGITSG